MADETLTELDTAALDNPVDRSGVKTEVYLGLLWLGITAFTAYASLHGVPGAPGPISAAVEAMPDVISSALITAATIAGAAAGVRDNGPLRRLLIGLATGAVFGVVTAFGVRIAYGASPSVTVLCVAVAVACVLGGAFALVPGAVLDSSLWAMTWVLFAGLILSVLKPNLLTMLGGGATAETRFLYLQPAVAGLLAAMHSVRWLRSDNPALFWYPVAGALSGVYLLATEGLGHLSGKALSATPDGAVGQALFTDAAKLKYAAIVLTVGGVLALVIGARRPR